MVLRRGTSCKKIMFSGKWTGRSTSRTAGYTARLTKIPLKVTAKAAERRPMSIKRFLLIPYPLLTGGAGLLKTPRSPCLKGAVRRTKPFLDAPLSSMLIATSLRIHRPTSDITMLRIGMSFISSWPPVPCPWKPSPLLVGIRPTFRKIYSKIDTRPSSRLRSP